MVVRAMLVLRVVATFLALNAPGAVVVAAGDLFSAADADHDGALSPAEFKTFLATTYDHQPDQGLQLNNMTASSQESALATSANRWEQTKLCTVFFTQHKSAGVTVFSTLTNEMPISFRGKPVDAKKGHGMICDVGVRGVFDWDKHLCPHLVNVSVEKPRVLYNGLVLSMAGYTPWQRSRCLYFTLFREPVSRLVSYKNYCSHNHFSKDPLCGHPGGAWFSAASPLEVAVFWGNYNLQNFLLHPDLTPLRGNHTGPKAVVGKTRFTSEQFWQRWRRELKGGDDPSTPEGASNLERVLNFLPGGFDFIGIVEEWDTSCEVFDCFLPLEKGTWAGLTVLHKDTHGKSTPATKKAQQETLAAARAEPRVLEALSADISIYNAALALFRANTKDLWRSGSPACAPWSRPPGQGASRGGGGVDAPPLKAAIPHQRAPVPRTRRQPPSARSSKSAGG